MNEDYKRLIELINSENFTDVNHWPSLQLNKQQLDEKLLNEVSGIYVIKNLDGLVFFTGKAKSLYDRLNSHFKATQGKETAEAWKEFFEHFKVDLTFHYKVIDGFSNESAENARKALERILQIKYRPLFDRLYKKGYKKIDDNKDAIRKLSL